MSPGEHIGVSRFSINPERYQVPSRVIDLSSSRAQAEAARARGRAYGFAVYRDAETWAERVKGTLSDTGARPRVGEHTYGLVQRRLASGTLWRSWLLHFISAPEVPAPQPDRHPSRVPPSTGPCVRLWRTGAMREAFAACALMRARLAADFGEPVGELRTLLRTGRRRPRP